MWRYGFLQVCCVTRLVPQKGVHLLRQAIFHVLKQGGQFILQGTSQIPAIKVFSIYFYFQVQSTITL